MNIKKIQLFLFSFILCNSLFSQKSVTSDTLFCNSTIEFKKVKKSFKEAKTAIMKINYKSENQTGFLKFEIPSFIFRLKTTLSDYCIIETKTKQIKLQNIEEITTKNLDILSYYDFTFSLSKDSLLNILTDGIRKVTFYFAPNPDIKVFLNKNKLVNEQYNKLTIRNSKKTITYTISKPERDQYNQVLFCLNTLSQ